MVPVSGQVEARNRQGRRFQPQEDCGKGLAGKALLSWVELDCAVGLDAWLGHGACHCTAHPDLCALKVSRVEDWKSCLVKDTFMLLYFNFLALSFVCARMFWEWNPGPRVRQASALPWSCPSVPHPFSPFGGARDQTQGFTNARQALCPGLGHFYEQLRWPTVRPGQWLATILVTQAAILYISAQLPESLGSDPLHTFSNLQWLLGAQVPSAVV